MSYFTAGPIAEEIQIDDLTERPTVAPGNPYMLQVLPDDALNDPSTPRTFIAPPQESDPGEDARRVVEHGSEHWAAETLALTGPGPRELTGYRAKRRSVTITNQSAGLTLIVAIGPDAGAVVAGGCALPPGAGRTLNSKGRVWAACATATPAVPAVVDWMEEYD